MKNKNVRCLCEGAILVAAAVALSFLKVAPVPSGGSIDLVMIPLVFFAVRWGLAWGLGACLVYGAIDMLFSGGFAYMWQAIFLDYLLAYMVVGFAGIMKHRKWGIVTGGTIGGICRFAVHTVSGVILWGEYMPDEFLNMTMTDPWVYSILYNSTYMLPNIILVIIFGVVASGTLIKYIEGEDLSNLQKQGAETENN